jgi:hypothetical protein
MQIANREKNVTLTVSMSKEMLEDITRFAEESGLTRSSFACSLIYNGLLEHKGKKKAIDSLPDTLQKVLSDYVSKAGQPLS